MALQAGLAIGQTSLIEFVKIQPGEIMMGCAEGESPYLPDSTSTPCNTISKPAHRVRIAAKRP